MKKFIFSIVTCLIVGILLFGFLEITFRLFRGKPDYLRQSMQVSSEQLHHADFERTHYSSIEGEFSYNVKINNLGYRGPEFLAKKPEGVKRIFVVGDSFTYGIGANESETIPSVISQLLSQEFDNIEVINAGAGSTSPINHYYNFKNMHLKYSPDFALVLLDLTDLMDDYRTEQNAVFDKEGNVVRFDPRWVNGKLDWWRYAVSKSKFLEWVNNKVVRLIRKVQVLGIANYFSAKKEGRKAKADIIASGEEITDEARLKFDALLMMRGESQKELIDEQWKRTGKYLLMMDQLFKENNIPWVLGMYPHGTYVGKDEWAEGRKTWGFPANTVDQDYYAFFMVEDWAKKHGIPFINTTGAVIKEKRRNPEKQFFWPWDGHMTPIAYRTVAEDIVFDPVFINEFNKALK